MGEIIEEITDDFSFGIVDHPRNNLQGGAQAVSNFDIFTNKNRMVPYFDSESGDSAASTSQKRSFEVAYWTPSGGSYRLFSLGIVASSGGKPEILMKTLTTGGSTDLSDAGWLAPANNAAGSGDVTAYSSYKLFRYYKTTGKIYGALSGSTIWAFTPDGSTAFDASHHSLSYASIGQAVVHSKDDMMYIPYDNKIARNNNGSWTDAAITVPSKYNIVSICEHGNYLALGCAPVSGIGKSVVYLWDRDASLTTLAETIDFGEGELKWVESLEGYIIAASQASGNSVRNKSRIIFRRSDGTNAAKKFKEIIATFNESAILLNVCQKVDNRIYFMLGMYLDHTLRQGVWSIGVASSGAYTLSHERSCDNDTGIGTNFNLIGFYLVGDYMFISFINASSAFQLSKTNDQESYSVHARYESCIKNASNSDLIKKLLGFSAMFEPLPANGIVKGYYKKDSETDWTRCFVYSTDGELSHGTINIENAASDTFTVTIASPGVFTSATAHGLIADQKIRLRTTGALPTGLTAGVEYYVIVVTTTTFQLSLLPSTIFGWAAINTTGTQSGTHTIDRTYNLTEGKEFRFKIESYGGAVITAWRYKMETVDKRLY